MNNVNFIGNIGNHPKLSTTSKGVNILRFSLAVDRPKNKEEEDASADWFSIKIIGDEAIKQLQFLQKGSRIGLSGRIHTSKVSKENFTYFKTEIVAINITWLDKIKAPEKEIIILNIEQI